MFTRVVRGPQKVISDVVWRKIFRDGSGIDKSRLLTMFRQLLYSAISCNSSKVIEAGERHALRTRNSPVDFARGQKFDQKPEGSDDIIGTSSFTMGRSFFCGSCQPMQPLSSAFNCRIKIINCVTNSTITVTHKNCKNIQLDKKCQKQSSTRCQSFLHNLKFKKCWKNMKKLMRKISCEFFVTIFFSVNVRLEDVRA